MKKCKICKNKVSDRNKSGHCNSCAQRLVWKENPSKFDGANNPFFGSKHTIEYLIELKARTKEKNNNYRHGKRARLYDYCAQCGKPVTCSCRSGLCKSCSRKKIWKNKEFKDRVINKIINSLKNCECKQNKLENRLEKILIDLNLNFKYVGNRKYWINRFNPDFVDIKNKRIIELFGDYWHRNTKHKDRLRIIEYKKRGFKTLIIWQHDFKNINKLNTKIISFTQKGI